jgi:hypothetical protein
MILNPNTFGLYNAILSYEKLFPEGRKNVLLDLNLLLFLIFYSIMTLAHLVLVVVIEEHQFRKVFIKYEEGEGENENEKEVIG